MALSSEMSTAGVASELQHVEFKDIAKYMISRQLRTGDYSIIQKVANEVSRESQHRLKEAIFYLEYADWNLHDALMHIELDNEDRNGSWLPVDLGEDNGSVPGSNSGGGGSYKRKRDGKQNVTQAHTSAKPTTHHSICEYAKPGTDFHEALFTLPINPSQTHTASTFHFPETYKCNFNKNSQEDIDNLNRWRRAIVWSKLGPDNGTTIRGQGERWHPLQETFVRNRFAFVAVKSTEAEGQLTNIRPDFRGICDLYREIFEGVLLPGRAKACNARTHNAIASFLHRDCIDRPLRLGGLNTAVVKCLPTNVKHEMARDFVVKEWEQKLSRMNMDESAGELIYQS